MNMVRVKFLKSFFVHAPGSVALVTKGQAYSLCEVYKVAERIVDSPDVYDSPDAEIASVGDDDETVDLDPPADPPKRKRGRPRKIDVEKDN